MKQVSICVVRNDQVGDVALTCPLLYAIKAVYPKSQLTVIAQELTYPLLKQIDCIDDIVIDFRKQSRLPVVSLLKTVVSYFKTHAIDYVFFAYMDPLYVIAAQLAGVPHRIGDGNKRLLAPFLTEKIMINWHDFTKHEVDQQLRLLEPFKPVKTCPDISLTIHPDTYSRCKELLRDIYDIKYLIVHPGYGKGNRVWHLKEYAKFIDYIHHHTSYKVVITGTTGEKEMGDIIVKHCRTNVLNLMGKTTLNELSALISQSTCLIGPETGPSHIASICKVPIISISPTKYTSSFRWGPFETNHIILKNNGECSLLCHPYKKPCSETHCLDSIFLKDVKKSLLFLMQQDVFPSNPLYYRFQTNGSVVIHCDSNSSESIATIRHTIKLLVDAGVRCHVSTSSSHVYKQIQCIEVPCFYASKWNIKSWVKYFALYNITIWHSISSLSSRWVTIVTLLIASIIDRSPVYIESQKKVMSIKDLLDLYIHESGKLSQ